MSFNLETALSIWRHYFAQRHGFLKEDLDELERHVRDHVCHAVKQGTPEEDAFWEAVREVGDYEGAEEEYGKVYWQKLKRRHLLVTEIERTISMWKNYLKIAWRNTLREKGYAAINVIGLAVGIAFCTLIFLYVHDELTYDHFHTHADQIYRVQLATIHPDGSRSIDYTNQPIPLGPALRDDLPDFKQYVRLYEEEHYMRPAENTGEVLEGNVLFADPSILQVFTFPLQQGNPATALSDPSSVVITKATAHKLFGDKNPMGRILQIRLDQTFEDFTVTGVTENVPTNSTIQFDILLPFQRLLLANERFRKWSDWWGLMAFQTYITLKPGKTASEIEAKLPSLYAKYHQEEVAKQGAEGTPETQPIPTYHLQPLREIHLESVSSPVYSYILSGIALVVLLIACINFMTLSIGRSARRAKEVGVRKVVGAQRKQIMAQFWGEAFLLSGIALVVGLLLAFTFLPVFNSLTGKTLGFGMGGGWVMGAALAGLVVVTGLIAGSYPALVLSGFGPIETLTNRLRFGKSSGFTKSFVVLQFAFTVFLITSTLVMTRQLAYTRSTDLGFDKEQVVVIPTSGLDAGRMAERFRTELEQQPNILGMTATNRIPGMTESAGAQFGYEGRQHTIDVFHVDANYMDFFNLDLIAGRNFNPAFSTDSSRSIIVNEALVRDFGIADPLGHTIPGLPGVTPETAPRIIGVVKDYHFQSLYKDVTPMLIDFGKEYQYLLVRIRPTGIPQSLGLLRKTWEQVTADVPFAYSFLDDEMQAQYQNDRRWSQIIQYATLFAVLIACLGLLGLAALTVTRRTKEIGIRKVLGASVSHIVVLISWEFALLVTLGVLLAAPIAYFTMSRWLQDFAYRIKLGPGIFLLAGGLTLLIALLTVCYQSIRAALSDPVKSLRYE